MLHTIDEVDDDEVYEEVQIVGMPDELDANELWLLDIKQIEVVEYLRVQLEDVNIVVEITQFIVSVLYEHLRLVQNLHNLYLLLYYKWQTQS